MNSQQSENSVIHEKRRAPESHRRAIEWEELKMYLAENGNCHCPFSGEEAATLQRVAQDVETVRKVTFSMVIKAVVNLLLACGLTGTIVLLFKALRD
jgi:hypothetical protein